MVAIVFYTRLNLEKDLYVHLIQLSDTNETSNSRPTLRFLAPNVSLRAVQTCNLVKRYN